MTREQIIEERRDAASHAFAAAINVLRNASRLPEYAAGREAVLDLALALSGDTGRHLIETIAEARGPSATLSS